MLRTAQQRVTWGLIALSSLGIAGYAYTYLTPGFRPPPGVGDNPFARPWLFVHAGLAATALLMGPWQFLPRMRARWPAVHRWIGRIYVAACLIGGSAGFVIGFGSTAGPIARSGFVTLAVVWILSTAMGWRMARARRFDEHRAWMIRSFALTFAAVTLRIYLPLVQIAHQPFLEWYRAIAWLAWVPNLMVAELYIAATRRRLAPARPAMRKAA